MTLNDIHLLYEFNYWAKAECRCGRLASGRIALQRNENKLRDSSRHARPHLRGGTYLAAAAYRHGQPEVPDRGRHAELDFRQSKMAGG